MIEDVQALFDRLDKQCESVLALARATVSGSERDRLEAKASGLVLARYYTGQTIRRLKGEPE